MSLLQWDENLSVGVEQFDREHRKLIAIMNELFDAIQTGHAELVLGPILVRLVDYTMTHFSNEERAMREAGYEGLAEHKALHDELIRRVAEVQRHYREGAASVVSTELMDFLKNWLIGHIQIEDKQYAPVLARETAGV